MRERIKTSANPNINQQVDTARDFVVREIFLVARDRKPSDELDTALRNLAVYVETVHHQGYSDSLISCLFDSLSHLYRLTFPSYRSIFGHHSRPDIRADK